MLSRCIAFQAQQKARKAAAEAARCTAELNEAAAAKEQLAAEVTELTDALANTKRDHAEQLSAAHTATSTAEGALATLRERAQVLY